MRTRFPRYAISVAVGTALLAFVLLPFIPSARQNLAFARQASTAAPTDDAALLDGYRHVEVASVSDAMEKVTGKRAYMSHHMRPIFPAKFAGFAVTVLLKKEENTDPNALSGMLAAIDAGTANSVYVMKVDDGADIAGMGGLMGTAMAARNFSGAVIDGGVRDVAYLQKIGFPVFGLGIVPSTSVGHYRFGGSNIPVVCDGVPVNAGDITRCRQRRSRRDSSRLRRRGAQTRTRNGFQGTLDVRDYRKAQIDRRSGEAVRSNLIKNEREHDLQMQKLRITLSGRV